MKVINIALLNDSSQGIGGGWTFLRNLKKSFTYFPEIKYVERIEDSDICVVGGVTMVERQTIDKVQQLGKKLVVRIDNVPRNSRNRNTGTSRLKEFAGRADAVVWQCKWARSYLEDFVKPKSEGIIYNGVDTDIFNPDGDVAIFSQLGKYREIYLYSRFSRDETKNWEVAWYEYQLIQRANKDAGLVILGKFSPEQNEYNFDFFRGEKILYVNVIHDPYVLAETYRGSNYLMATYYNDCYSNTYLEALACGVKLYKPNMTGGTPELIENWEKGLEWNGLKRMGQDYRNLFESL